MPAPGLTAAVAELNQLAGRLAALRGEDYGDTASRVDVTWADDGIRVHCYFNEDAESLPEVGEKIFTEIIRRLASREIGPWLAELRLEGDQIASNGTIDWEIKPIAYAPLQFARLKVFRIESVGAADEPYSAGTLVGRDWRDTSVATRFLKRMPALEELSIPEPPKEEAFFQGRKHPLRKLTVFDTDFESFIARLAVSRRFAGLTEVRFVESARSDANPRLPLADYLKLFESDAFPLLSLVTIEQAGLSDHHIQRLQNTRVGKQLTRLTTKSAQSCDRPILHAPEDFGLAAPVRSRYVCDDDCVYLAAELEMRFLPPLQACAEGFKKSFPSVRTTSSSMRHQEGKRVRGLTIALSCEISDLPTPQAGVVNLELCFDNLNPHNPTAEVRVLWSETGLVEADLFSGKAEMTEDTLRQLAIDLPGIIEALRNAIQRCHPPT